MLQRLAAWCYRRRRRVVVLWIVALVAVSVIGSNVGSTFSQGFHLVGHRVATRGASCSSRASRRRRATRARSSSPHAGGVGDAGRAGTAWRRSSPRWRRSRGVTAVVSPYTADGARQVARER